jgi:hypothetical protein
MSHLAVGSDLEFISLAQPFSSFQFVEDRFSGSNPIRKIFSTARCRKAGTLVYERIPAQGNIADENDCILALDPGFVPVDLIRLSFWECSLEESGTFPEDKCIGYAILKHDKIPKKGWNTWHVYEAVIRSYPHAHNFANAAANFEFRCVEQVVSVPGCLYAQQNSFTKTCAQVAIRSIVSTFFGNNDLSYRKINEAAFAINSGFDPSKGMTNDEIVDVLVALGLNVLPMDYGQLEAIDPDIRDILPYQKVVYSGIESGCGALLAFELKGPAAPHVGHVIPFFGHTFNEDSWAPTGGPAYFQFGEHIRYISSRTWLSSFLVHDDNFGANLCVPQSFLNKKHVSCVFEILPTGWACSGVEAEVAAADYFYSILPNLPPSDDVPWLRRLWEYVYDQRLILRHVPISKNQYLEHLRSMEDWDFRKEADNTIEAFESSVSGDKFWMVEVSVPEVFPTNKRKLGEILLDASTALSAETDGISFILARFPGAFVFFEELDSNGDPTFALSPSNLRSHVPLYSTLGSSPHLIS